MYFAAYAFAWMEFPGRKFLFVCVVGLLVVPLQMSLIPLLSIYNEIGNYFGVTAKSYPGIWLAHTGFGLPLAIYFLRNYMGNIRYRAIIFITIFNIIIIQKTQENLRELNTK